jgi:hypothetical protein
MNGKAAALEYLLSSVFLPPDHRTFTLDSVTLTSELEDMLLVMKFRTEEI